MDGTRGPTFRKTFFRNAVGSKQLYRMFIPATFERDNYRADHFYFCNFLLLQGTRDT